MKISLRKFVSALAAVILLCGISLPTRAQTTFGSITGTVTDPNGAAIPGAAVTATNEGTGVPQRVKADSHGVFNVPDLDPGSYRLEVSAPGLKTEQRKGIAVYAHQVINLNIQLARVKPRRWWRSKAHRLSLTRRRPRSVTLKPRRN